MRLGHQLLDAISVTGANDRRLIVEGLFYKRDILCTRDYYTILRYRDQLQKHSIRTIDTI